MKFLAKILAGLLALSAGAARADDAQAALKRFADEVQTLSAAFTQVQTDEHGKVLSSSAGHMLLSRPGRFRWTYETPYQQLIVCDGVKVWLYDEDLSQVTVRGVGDALKGTPAELLTQKVLLSDAFKIEDGGMDGKLRKVRLKPKSADSDFKSIELSLDGGTPVRMKFFDQLGGTTPNWSRITSQVDPQIRVTMPNGISTPNVVERGLVSGGCSTIRLYSGARAQQPGFCLLGEKVSLSIVVLSPLPLAGEGGARRRRRWEGEGLPSPSRPPSPGRRKKTLTRPLPQAGEEKGTASIGLWFVASNTR